MARIDAEAITLPRILNKHTHGIPADATYIGRGSPWGNPFVIGRDGNRNEVVAKYAAWVLTQPQLLARLHGPGGPDPAGCFSPHPHCAKPPASPGLAAGQARPYRAPRCRAAPARLLQQSRVAPGTGPKRPVPGATRPRPDAHLRA